MKSLSKAFLALLVTLLFQPVGAHAQSSITNEAVVKMVKAGLAEDVIISMITLQPAQFSITPDAMITLKKEGVSDKVIAAMISKAQPAGPAASSATANSAPPVASAPPDSTANLEIGVYFKKKDEWMEVLPEVVNWKTGGVLKKIASAGVIKGDVNGNIAGKQSRNSATAPAEFLIRTAEGVSITEYQLLRLRVNKNNREFRTVTGGVLHTSGGATRDVVPFEGKKTGNRSFVVVLPNNLGAGEYGFLPPGAVMSGSSASLGKMYTFRIVE